MRKKSTKQRAPGRTQTKKNGFQYEKTLPRQAPVRVKPNHGFFFPRAQRAKNVESKK